MNFEADGRPDLIRLLRQNAYYAADRERCDVEQTVEWRAAEELAAWRNVMPQYEFRDGTIHRTLASLPSTVAN